MLLVVAGLLLIVASNQGDNVKVVSERLGNASAKMTLDFYVRPIPTLQREAATKMDSLLFANRERLGERERWKRRKSLIPS